MDKRYLVELAEKFGDAFYTLESEQFKKNYVELKKEFCDIYPNFNIAYSYKTNYCPRLCKIVDEMGGYAEVVSDMELDIALKLGVEPTNIIWNGPYKNSEKIEKFLLAGGIINLDAAEELKYIKKIMAKNPKKTFRLGMRCNFDVGDGVVSRFGFDVESKEFSQTFKFISESDSLKLVGLQCHFATRALATWKPRAERMLALIDFLDFVPEYIDLGGGIFGKMEESLKSQFDTAIPTYKDYAEAVAPLFAKKFASCVKKPQLLIEPGSALVGDCMKFVSRVTGIKKVRGKAIATLLGSIYNINPTLNKKNPPIKIYQTGTGERNEYENLDFGGFTCIESDYLYRNYSGTLAIGDFIVFGNVGSYSIVLKPPFILPNFPILDLSGADPMVVKRSEVFDDLFHTYKFTF